MQSIFFARMTISYKISSNFRALQLIKMKIMQPKKITPFLLSLFFFIPIALFCQSDTTNSPIVTEKVASKKEQNKPDFFASTTIFQKIKRDSFYEVILQADFDSLIKNKKISMESYPGTVLFKNGKGEQFKMKVKIEPRGRSRRKVCSSMPPLKIDFPKKALKKLGLFPGCDKLKLVTNCNDTEDSDQVLMKEYWIYNLYNRITPHSFQVFPVKITYVNANDPDERIQRFAFFIENNKELELRLKGKAIPTLSIYDWEFRLGHQSPTEYKINST